MKKSFLIAGLIAGLAATNGYALQSGTIKVTCTCPEDCFCLYETDSNGQQSFRCICDDGREVAPDINIIQMVTGSNAINHNVTNQSTISPKKPKLNKVSARVAETPKITKKIVYEEIISDDDAE